MLATAQTVFLVLTLIFVEIQQRGFGRDISTIFPPKVFQV